VTKVITRRRPLVASNFVEPQDAFRLRIGDQIRVDATFPWWARAIQWVATRVFRLPAPFATAPLWVVVAVDMKDGRVLLEARAE
jgi:hypothetical protein